LLQRKSHPVNVVKLALVPEDCKKFETCSAPVCPFDPLWRTAAHLPGERVCPYLLGSGKEGAAEWYREFRLVNVRAAS
jgi:hypothetical protein